MHGEGTYKWPDGRMYKGSYINDKKDGFGVYSYPDKRQYSGQWSNGVQHGEGTFRSPTGVERKGIWKEGKRIGWTDGKDTSSTMSGQMSLQSRKFRGTSSKASSYAKVKK